MQHRELDVQLRQLCGDEERVFESVSDLFSKLSVLCAFAISVGKYPGFTTCSTKVCAVVLLTSACAAV